MKFQKMGWICLVLIGMLGWGCGKGLGEGISEGFCCDGQGKYKNKDDGSCHEETEYRCLDACGQNRESRTLRQSCSGESATCDGDVEEGAWEKMPTCEANQVCVLDADNIAQCETCPDPQFCKEGKCIICDGEPCCGEYGFYKEPSDGWCHEEKQYRCLEDTCGANRKSRSVLQYCSGESASCDGVVVEGAWKTMPPCQADQICVLDSTNFAKCENCPDPLVCMQGECRICLDGPCCDEDGLYKAPSDEWCHAEKQYRCLDDTCGNNRQSRFLLTYCSGESKQCDGELVETAWEEMEACDSAQVCQLDDDNVAQCETCLGSLICNRGECKECDQGACCDKNGYLKKTSDACHEEIEYRCLADACGPNRETRSRITYCSGESATCNGVIVETVWETMQACDSNQVCEIDPDNIARCKTCESSLVCIDGDCNPFCQPGFGSIDGETCSTCVRYVNGDAAPDGDGLTWQTAINNIQDGLALARQATSAQDGPHVCEVWVAAGTYFLYGSEDNEDHRNDALRLYGSERLYGGFVGDEVSRHHRDWSRNKTILDGREDESSENRVFHVVLMFDNASIDGFTITQGKNADKRGAGLEAKGWPLISNCTFTHNESDRGGAIHNAGSATIRDCIFSHNRSTAHGGAIYGANRGELTIEHCVFVNNTTDNGKDAQGGAIWADGRGTISDSVFSLNYANRGGGVSIASGEYKPFKVKRSIFVGNHSSRYGGAIKTSDANMTYENCIVAGNRSDDISGAFSLFGAPIFNIINCTVVNNEGKNGADVLRISRSIKELNITNSIIHNGPDWLYRVDDALPNVSYSNTDYTPGISEDPTNLSVSPEFVGFPLDQGTSWTTVTYHNETMQTVLVDATRSDSSTPWIPGQLKGLLVNPNTSEVYLTYIVHNTANAITVWGDATAFVRLDSNYKIYDLSLKSDSPCIDTAKGPVASKLDLSKQARFDHTPAPNGATCGEESDGFCVEFVDMGAYEFCTGDQCEIKDCEDGPCCDGDGYYRDPTADLCLAELEYRCLADVCGLSREQRTLTQRCSGTSAGCDGEEVVTAWEPMEACDANQVCALDEAGIAQCQTCDAQKGCVAGGCSCEFETCHDTCCDEGQVCGWDQACGQPEFKLVAPGLGSGDFFGFAMSMSGPFLFVGAPLHQGRGAVFVFKRNQNNNFSFHQKLSNPNLLTGELFGGQVVVSGDVAVIGARLDGTLGTNTGAAFVFEYNLESDEWYQTKQLTAPQAQTEAQFGLSVSTNGSTIVVGAPYEDDPENGTDAGVVYVFERDQDQYWAHAKTLRAFDGNPHDRLGWFVTIEADTIFANASLGGNGTRTRCGAVYVFERNAENAWVAANTAKLENHDLADYDRFGTGMVIKNDLALVGAYRHDTPGVEDGGAVYVYQRDQTTRTWQAASTNKLVPFDNPADSAFGISVSVDGDWAAVGASTADGSVPHSGAVYLFQRSDTGDWLPTQSKLIPLQATAGEQRYGFSTVLQDGILLVGAFEDGSGAVYVY